MGLQLRISLIGKYQLSRGKLLLLENLETQQFKGKNLKNLHRFFTIYLPEVIFLVLFHYSENLKEFSMKTKKLANN